MIVPYPFPTHQVQQLMEEVASRFSRFHTGTTELKMSELRTLDGHPFLLFLSGWEERKGEGRKREGLVLILPSRLFLPSGSSFS